LAPCNSSSLSVFKCTLNPHRRIVKEWSDRVISHRCLLSWILDIFVS